MARLRRTRDGAGQTGSLVKALDFVDGELVTVGNKPMVGYALEVGTLTGGTFSHQDWWRTTRITEIIEEKPGYMKFKTGNSTYEFWE